MNDLKTPTEEYVNYLFYYFEEIVIYLKNKHCHNTKESFENPYMFICFLIPHIGFSAKVIPFKVSP